MYEGKAGRTRIPRRQETRSTGLVDTPSSLGKGFLRLAIGLR